jgi:hypothetical protein
MPTNGDTSPTNFHGQNGQKAPKMAQNGPNMAKIENFSKLSQFLSYHIL